MTERQAKTQISLGIRPVWSESSLCAQWVAKYPRFLYVDSKDNDQTGQMLRLIWVFAACTLTFLVLSCCGSYRTAWMRRLIQWHLSCLNLVETGFFWNFMLPLFKFSSETVQSSPEGQIKWELEKMTRLEQVWKRIRSIFTSVKLL